MDGTTYDVRIYKTAVYKGAKVTTYYVRWKVDGREWKTPFRTAAQADSHRSALLSATRAGEAFALKTGRPISWGRDEPGMSWYDFACAYAAAKWPYAAPNHRRGIAEALTDITEVLVRADAKAPSRQDTRKALRDWAFSARARDGSEPSADIAAAARWVEQHSIALADLAKDDGGAIIVRAVLDRISRKQDGTLAAANTANRKRMVLNNAMEYACEIGALPANPLRRVKWAKPRTAKAVDPRVVINSGQARELLAAVAQQGEIGRRLVAFFALMYYAALRPAEAIDLRRGNLVSLPSQGWGSMRLSSSEPRAGRKFTNGGKSRERRELKHRAANDTRTVPLHPELVAILRNHLAQFVNSANGRLFIGPRGGIIAEWAYLDSFHQARQAILDSHDASTPLASRPYALRHAATWLNAGVPAPQVAEWAGHSVDVLLRVYAKCIAGQQEDAKRRIEEATKAATNDATKGNEDV
jgi:integrase